MAKVRRVGVYFHWSPHALAVLCEKQQALDITSLKLKLDVVTRWNSTYDMVDRYLKTAPAVGAAQVALNCNARRKLDMPVITAEEILILEEFLEVKIF